MNGKYKVEYNRNTLSLKLLCKMKKKPINKYTIYI